MGGLLKIIVVAAFYIYHCDVSGEVCQVVEVDGKNQLDCFWGRKTPIINDYDFTGWTAPDLVSLYLPCLQLILRPHALFALIRMLSIIILSIFYSVLWRVTDVTSVTPIAIVYLIVPNNSALPNKDAPYGLRKAQTDENGQNCPKVLNNCPIS